MDSTSFKLECARDLEKPVLIAGPTASGKSSLAIEIADTQGRQVVNADALQVFSNWRILTARPTRDDEARVPHKLYGHVAYDAAYSVGHWLQEITPIIGTSPAPVIVGGTGLYMTALTEGLADIPEIPNNVRQTAISLMNDAGLSTLLDDLDASTKARIDTANPMRVLRAWEVQKATGRSIADWQDNTPPPTLDMDQAICVVLEAPKDWLNQRIETRFDAMLADGVMEEVHFNLETWHPDHASSKAIGAADLIAVAKNEMTVTEARDAVFTATRQFAKRQRTWFRARMKHWRRIPAQDL